MKLDVNVTLETKIAAMEDLGRTFAADPKDAFAHLFFAARNGAISNLLLIFEHYFQDRGFAVRAAWKETSFPGVSVELVLNDKRTGEHERRLQIDRQTTRAPEALGSQLVYALKAVHAGAYYRNRKPQVAVDFDAILETQDFHEFVSMLVLGANYPFAYESHSSF